MTSAAALSPEVAERLVRDYVQTVWELGEFHRLGEFVASDCVFSDLYGDQVLRGRPAVEDSIRQWLGVVRDCQARLQTVIVQDDQVAWQWSLTGRLRDPEVLPAGRRGSWAAFAPITIVGATFSKIRDGLIAEERTQADLKGLLEQMGLRLR